MSVPMTFALLCVNARENIPCPQAISNISSFGWGSTRRRRFGRVTLLWYVSPEFVSSLSYHPATPPQDVFGFSLGMGFSMPPFATGENMRGVKMPPSGPAIAGPLGKKNKTEKTEGVDRLRE